MLTAIDHIGIAVRSLDAAVAVYSRLLGVACAGVETVPSQRVRLAVFPVGNARIELLEATDDESPIARFIAQRGEGLHHIAFRSTGLDGELARTAAAGLRQLTTVPPDGAGGNPIAFLHPKDLCGVLVELCAARDAHRDPSPA